MATLKPVPSLEQTLARITKVMIAVLVAGVVGLIGLAATGFWLLDFGPLGVLLSLGAAFAAITIAAFTVKMMVLRLAILAFLKWLARSLRRPIDI